MRAWRVRVGLVGLASGLLLLTLWFLPLCQRPEPGLYPPPAGGGITIQLVDHGWHAGLVLPVEALRSRLPPLPADLLSGPYLEIGWGDEGFYQAGSFEAIDAGLAARALLLPTPSVLHLVVVPRPPRDYFPASGVIELQLSEAGLTRLLDAIAQTFSTDTRGLPLDAGAGLYGHSRFFAARPSYHLLRTCNQWTAEALLQAGLPLVPGHVFTVGQLNRQLLAAGGRRTAGAAD